MKNTNKPRTKNSTRENIDLLVQKISESGLIGYQDNTTTHIGDLINEKAKKPKKIEIWVYLDSSEVKTIQILLGKLPNLLLNQL